MADRPVTELRVKDIGERRSAWLDQLRVRWECTTVSEVVRRLIDLVREEDEREPLPAPTPTATETAPQSPAAKIAQVLGPQIAGPRRIVGRFRQG